MCAARGEQPVKILAGGIGPRHAGAKGGAIVEAGSQRRRAVDEETIEPGRERAVLIILVDQALGEQNFFRPDALVAGAPRRRPEYLGGHAGLLQKGDFRRQRLIRSR